MKGQLWEDCFCGTEPVCANCFKCEKHCKCDSVSQTPREINTECEEPYRKGIGQGFGTTEDGE